MEPPKWSSRPPSWSWPVSKTTDAPSSSSLFPPVAPTSGRHASSAAAKQTTGLERPHPPPPAPAAPAIRHYFVVVDPATGATNAELLSPTNWPRKMSTSPSDEGCARNSNSAVLSTLLLRDNDASLTLGPTCQLDQLLRGPRFTSACMLRPRATASASTPRLSHLEQKTMAHS